MSAELKPCPFCGGHAIIDGCDDTLWIVICKECNVSIGYKETECEAIDAWNKRVQPTFSPANVTQSKKCLKNILKESHTRRQSSKSATPR